MLDAENGYLSHPYLTCGPYKLVSYDRESGTVEFAINEFYVGNYEGVRPVIDTVTLVPVLPQDMKEKLESGESSLEESFKYYEAGMKLVRSLSSQIDKVEKQIQILSEGEDNE